MTAVIWPHDLLTIDDWEALEDPAFRRAELVEGVIQMSPAPTVPHQVAMRELILALTAAGRSNGLSAIGDVDVVLARRFPPTVRQPNVVLITREVARVRAKNLKASDVLLVIEIVSPGSARTDRIAKLADYADAGIPHYWIIDITGAPDGPVTLDAHVLDDAGYRRTVHAQGGIVELTEPLPVTVDLDTLTTG